MALLSVRSTKMPFRSRGGWSLALLAPPSGLGPANRVGAAGTLFRR